MRQLRLLFSVIFFFFIASALTFANTADSLHKEADKYISFYDEEGGEDVHYEVNFKDNKIVSLYRNRVEIPDEDINKYKDKIYNQLDEMRFGNKHFHFRMDDFAFDMDKFNEDMEKLNRELSENWKSYEFDFDDKTFKENMDKLKEKLGKLKHKKFEMKFDSKELEKKMEELNKYFKYFHFDCDSSKFNFDWQKFNDHNGSTNNKVERS